MEFDVLAHEARDEVVRMVVPVLESQLVGPLLLVEGLHDVLRLELVLQELVL